MNIIIAFFSLSRGENQSSIPFTHVLRTSFIFKKNTIINNIFIPYLQARFKDLLAYFKKKVLAFLNKRILNKYNTFKSSSSDLNLFLKIIK